MSTLLLIQHLFLWVLSLVPAIYFPVFFSPPFYFLCILSLVVGFSSYMALYAIALQLILKSAAPFLTCSPSKPTSLPLSLLFPPQMSYNQFNLTCLKLKSSTLSSQLEFDPFHSHIFKFIHSPVPSRAFFKSLPSPFLS